MELLVHIHKLLSLWFWIHNQGGGAKSKRGILFVSKEMFSCSHKASWHNKRWCKYQEGETQQNTVNGWAKGRRGIGPPSAYVKRGPGLNPLPIASFFHFFNSSSFSSLTPGVVKWPLVVLPGANKDIENKSPDCS